MSTFSPAQDAAAWDAFLCSQRYSPFLQSWTMGEVYRSVGQEPIRLEARENGKIVGICFGHIVRARRGTHLSIPYGPVVERPEIAALLIDALKPIALAKGCAFLRLSPFWPNQQDLTALGTQKIYPSPLHLLAEHLWYLPLTEPDSWKEAASTENGTPRTEDEIFKNLRSTTRNLIRRAQKEGVTVTASADPEADISFFLALHEETRKRHGFTPYTDSFFRAQLEHFAPRKEATLYLARYQGEVIAASMHMHLGSETSYHHGASTHKFSKIPASYLLQWTAIKDALYRGDRIYNFWGIAPMEEAPGGPKPRADHPFAGVTLFKTGFGGSLLELTHCMDIPLSPKYRLTRAFEYVRKWRRGF